MTTMPETQKAEIKKMDSGELLDFQIRLQIECGMTDADAANYIAKAFVTDPKAGDESTHLWVAG